MSESEDITLVSPNSAKYQIGQDVVLDDGSSAKIVGVDPVSHSYYLVTAQNKSIQVSPDKIKKLDKQKSADYRETDVELTQQTSTPPMRGGSRPIGRHVV